MPLISVTEEGTVIGVSGDGYFLKRNGRIIARLPQGIVDQIVIGPDVEISRKALARMSDTGVPVAFIDRYGRLKTRLVPVWRHNARLRINQALAWNDKAVLLRLSKRFVAAKLSNAAHVLNAYAKNYTDPILRAVRDRMIKLADNLVTAGSVTEVMGVEGVGSKYYWEAFGVLVRCNFCSWSGRNRRPPKDPINAVLSYTYSIVTQVALTYLELSGLDPYIGYLHSVDERKPSLALDMIEPFRALYADRLVLRLMNRGQIKSDDFEIDGHENNGIYMKLGARKLLVKEIYDSINMCDEQMGMLSPRSALIADIERLRKVCEDGVVDEFIPYFADKGSNLYRCLDHI